MLEVGVAGRAELVRAVHEAPAGDPARRRVPTEDHEKLSVPSRGTSRSGDRGYFSSTEPPAASRGTPHLAFAASSLATPSRDGVGGTVDQLLGLLETEAGEVRTSRLMAWIFLVAGGGERDASKGPPLLLPPRRRRHCHRWARGWQLGTATGAAALTLNSSRRRWGSSRTAPARSSRRMASRSLFSRCSHDQLSSRGCGAPPPRRGRPRRPHGRRIGLVRSRSGLGSRNRPRRHPPGRRSGLLPRCRGGSSARRVH